MLISMLIKNVYGKSIDKKKGAYAPLVMRKNLYVAIVGK